MFDNAEFWPTPPDVIFRMIEGMDITGKIVFEPQAGTGHIVDVLKGAGAKEVIACEKDPNLRHVLKGKCRIIAEDFLTVTSEQVSHIDAIVMNPPFWNAERHILHAYEIAPPGTKIAALCNLNTIKNQYTYSRGTFGTLVKMYGRYEDWGQCFTHADKQTNVEVAYIYLEKPARDYAQEFEGFFTEEEPEGSGEEGMMEYNSIRDIVNRYVAAVKLYDQQILLGVQMRKLTETFPAYRNEKGEQEHLQYLTLQEHLAEQYRATFKKDLQKRGWTYVFDKLNMNKYSTRGLKEDINRFVEQQVNIPFTMKNIYQMLAIVVGTAGSRMDKALEEVFEKITDRCHDNRLMIEGWKTNSHYLVNQKFILDWISEPSYSGGFDMRYNGNAEVVEDFTKALCFMTGKKYEDIRELRQRVRGERYISETDRWEKHAEGRPNWGEWFDWGFFECKAFKKGTMHFKFKSEEVWAEYNHHIARIKGFPLPETVAKPKTTKKQSQKQTAWA